MEWNTNRKLYSFTQPENIYFNESTMGQEERESGREEQGERGAQLKEWLSHLISITLKFPCHSIGVFENRQIVHEMIAAAAVCDYRIFTNGWQSSKIVIFFLLLARCCHFISYKLK